MKIELFIAIRHIIDRKLQSLLSILGVTIAISAFIVSLSISNGLERNMINSMLKLNPHISISNISDFSIYDYQEISDHISNIDGVENVIPEIENQAIIKSENYVKGVLSVGMDGDFDNSIEVIKLSDNKMLPTLDSIAIGEQLAEEIGVSLGDEISLVSAENKEIRFVVQSIFKTGFLQYDSNFVIIPLETMQILTEIDDAVTQLSVKLENPMNSYKIIPQIKEILGDNYGIFAWQDLNQSLLNTVKFEKFVLISLLSLLLVISSFAVSVILNMTVREKTKDIGILKSIGYSNNKIRNIFLIEGVIIGVVGIIISLIASPIVIIILRKIFVVYMSGSYYLEELPVYISFKEIIIINIFAIFVILLSILAPSNKASKLKPVEALKYD